LEDFSGVGRSSIDVYQKEDIDKMIDTGEKIVCFERLAIAGAIDLSTPFLANEIEAAEFLSRTLSYVDDGRKVEAAKSPITPNMPIKVTILLRSNNRFLINLVCYFLNSYTSGVS